MKHERKHLREAMKGAAAMLAALALLPLAFGADPAAETPADSSAPAPTATNGASTAGAASASSGVANPTDEVPEGAPAGDVPSTISEPVPVETGTPVPRNQRRDRFRRSRLTKDVSEGVADRRRVLLTTGEDKVVDLDFDVEAGPSGIISGNSQIVMTTLVRIAEQRRQIVFKPLKAGETTVTVRDPDGAIKVIFDVIVTQSNLLRRAGEIRELLKDIEGIDVKVVGPNVVVDGEVLVPADYARMVSVISTKPYSDFVMPLANLSALALQSLSRRIQEDINTFAPNVKTRVVNGMVFLEGAVDSLDQARRAEALAQLYLPEARPGNTLANQPGANVIVGRKMVQNFLVVNPPPPKKQDKLVRITVHFVELAKDYAKSFGFTWAPGFTSDPSITFGQQPNGQVGASSTSFTATLSSLFPKLASAQEAGYARVIRQGSIIVKNDIQGALAQNTQVPYITTTADGQQTTQFQTVGLSIKVKPTILGQSEDLQVFLDISQSSLSGQSTSGTPSISNRAVNTTLYLKSNESAAVGGFEGNDISTGFNKGNQGSGSFEGQTTPIFNLKRTKSHTKSKSQFVVFVTPQLIDNAAEASDDLKKNFRVKVK